MKRSSEMLSWLCLAVLVWAAEGKTGSGAGLPGDPWSTRFYLPIKRMATSGAATHPSSFQASKAVPPTPAKMELHAKLTAEEKLIASKYFVGQ